MIIRSTRSTLLVLLAALMAVVLVASACGEGDEPSAEPDPEPASSPDPEPAPAPSPDPAPSPGPMQKENPRVAQIHPDAVNAAGWYSKGTDAFKKMAEVLGSEPEVLERITYDEAPSTLRQLAADGVDIIVSHSSGYESAVLEVAPEFPETWFLIYSDLSTTNDLPNVAGWAVHWNEVGYLVATIACASSDANHVGMVVSAPIPAYTRWTGGSDQLSEESAEVLGEACEFNYVWTGDFVDVVKAKSAAEALIDGGADVLFDGADAAGAGAVESAVQNELMYVGSVVDQCEQAPDTIITSVIMNFDIAYAEMADLYAAGSLEPKIYPLNSANQGIQVTGFCNPDEEVQKAIDSVLEQIAAGSIVVDPTREVTS